MELVKKKGTMHRARFIQFCTFALLSASVFLIGCASTPGRDKPLDPVMATAVSPDGNILGVTTSTHEVACFDVNPLRFRSLLTREGAKVRVNYSTALLSPPLEFTSNGKTLITAGIRGEIVGWDIESGSRRFSSPIESGVLDISVVPNEPVFFTAGPGLSMWSSETGSQIRKFELPEGTTATSVCSSIIGKAVFVGLSNGEIALFDSETGKFIHKWKGHHVKVTGLVISPDGRSLASNAGLYDLRIWEIDSDFRPTVSPMNIDIMSAFDKVGDGTKTVAVLAWMAGTVSGYQLVGAPTLAFPSSVFDKAAITESPYGPQVAYSPDGRFLAASAHIQKLSGDFQVLLIDTMNKQVRMLEGIYGCSLAFTRDSRILLTGGLGAPVLWDVQTGEKLAPGEGVN